MRQSLLVSAVAAMWLVLGALLPAPLSWVLLYFSFVVGAAGAGMAFGRPGLLGKKPDGTLPVWSYVLWWPWHIAVRGVAWLNRMLEPRSVEVHPGWYLGGWPNRTELWDPWPSVLDMTCELPRVGQGEHYLCLPTWDGTSPTVRDVQRGVAFVLEQRAHGRPVLVHCAAGHSRSVTVLVAALTAAGLHPTWRDAFEHVLSVRPTARLTAEQREALSRWATSR